MGRAREGENSATFFLQNTTYKSLHNTQMEDIFLQLLRVKSELKATQKRASRLVTYLQKKEARRGPRLKINMLHLPFVELWETITLKYSSLWALLLMNSKDQGAQRPIGTSEQQDLCRAVAAGTVLLILPSTGLHLRAVTACHLRDLQQDMPQNHLLPAHLPFMMLCRAGSGRY